MELEKFENYTSKTKIESEAMDLKILPKSPDRKRVKECISNDSKTMLEDSNINIFGEEVIQTLNTEKLEDIEQSQASKSRLPLVNLNDSTKNNDIHTTSKDLKELENFE